MKLSTIVGQFLIGFDIPTNLHSILTIVENAEQDDLILLPEGAISGYSDDPALTEQLDPGKIKWAIAELQKVVKQKKVHLVCGACLLKEGHWYNTAVYFSPVLTKIAYRKINLATHERTHFTAGNKLPLLTLDLPHGSVQAGIQLCREIRFPEQWQYLARQGAQILLYLTNAANPREEPGVWRSHLISRAAENQRFVLSANIADAQQHCPTMIISPRGAVLQEVPASTAAHTILLKQEIDLADVSHWYEQQARRDVVDIVYKPSA
jgi:predicted amidohydrolase